MTAPLRIGVVRASQPLTRPGWRAGLGRHVTRSREALLRRLATGIAGVQERCGTDQPAFAPAHLPRRLDRQLHLLTLRLSADLDALCRDLSDRIAGEDAGRAADAVRTACVYGTYDTILVAPSGLATTLRGARIGTARRADGSGPTDAPFEIALAAACYPMWRERTDFHPAEVDVWLRYALDSVAAELLGAVVRRCDRIHAVLARTAAELADTAA